MTHIDPLVLHFFQEKVAEKVASAEMLMGAGALGAGLLGLGAIRNVNRDRAYGRAERLEELARRKKALITAKNAPRYNEGMGGGMH